MGHPIIWNLTDFRATISWYTEWPRDAIRAEVSLGLTSSAYDLLENNRPDDIDGDWLYSIYGEIIQNWSIVPYGNSSLSIRRDEMPWASFNYLGWKMTFNPLTRQFDLLNSWYCDDKDTDHL
jgi:hypothetical protein